MSSAYIDIRPFHPKEMARRSYPTNCTPSIFPKYDGLVGNAREHIRRYVDALTAHSHDHELRLKELVYQHFTRVGLELERHGYLVHEEVFRFG